MSSISAIYHQ